MLSIKQEPIPETPKPWRNWSGSVRCQPQTVAYPRTIEDVSKLVADCNDAGQTLRVVGSGHSFTPLVQTDDVLVSLDHLAGLITVNPEERTALVWAGTKLKDLGELLFEEGFAQENLGDINVQSLAGAISTGTHGTGIQFGTLSTQILAMTVVIGNGEVVDCSPRQNPELFKALQVSFGALGVIVKVRLRLVPTFRMRYTSQRMKLEDCLNQLDQLKRDHRHFEFYCFPHSDLVQVKLMDETDDAPTRSGWKDYVNKVILENRVFWVLSEMCRFFPGMTRKVSQLTAKSVPVFEEVGYSHNLFATPRLVRFNEMEYNIPAEHLPTVIREVLACIEREQFAVHFPIECRFVKADDIWLSPASGRDSAYVAIHMYRGMPHEPYFRAVEQIFLKYGGRPHWGKMNFRTGDDFRSLYPMWDRFNELRRKLDRKGVFLNQYLHGLFVGDEIKPEDDKRLGASVISIEQVLAARRGERV